MEGLFNQVMTQLSVVVPVYNESSLIHELIKRVSLNVKKIYIKKKSKTNYPINCSMNLNKLRKIIK